MLKMTYKNEIFYINDKQVIPTSLICQLCNIAPLELLEVSSLCKKEMGINCFDIPVVEVPCDIIQHIPRRNSEEKFRFWAKETIQYMQEHVVIDGYRLDFKPILEGYFS